MKKVFTIPCSTSDCPHYFQSALNEEGNLTLPPGWTREVTSVGATYFSCPADTQRIALLRKQKE